MVCYGAYWPVTYSFEHHFLFSTALKIWLLPSKIQSYPHQTRKKRTKPAKLFFNVQPTILPK